MDSSYSSSVDGEVASTSLKLPETAAALPQPESQMSDQSADENLVCQLLEGPDAEMFDLEVNEKPLDDKTPTTDALDAPANNVIGLSETSTKDMKNESFSTVDAPPSNVAPHEMENTTSDGRESTLNLSASKASISLVIETPADEPMEVDEDTAALALSTHPQPERDSANPQTDVNLPDNYPPVVYPAIDQTNGRVEIEQAPVESPKPEDADDGDKSTDEGEDDCTSSEVSEGVDFQEELQDALDDSNFSFIGSFYHAGLLFSSPNPCLHISGLGIVGLPLSDRDAKSIISCATLAPFGHGERTVVDKDVRHTWEIEPSRVSFANSHWDKYVKDVACVEVCKSLGVNLGNTRPRMELYKLLLYEKGSHFLPHQDTQKADGMFATVIIVLPSAYTGGQVILSHSSTKKKIDFAKESLFSTALLAWYTDVKHEVKEVTSGYRLALSYNLIHVAPPGVPQPRLPDMSDSLYLLRRVLKKWRDGLYEEESERNVAAYLLQHQYSPANLKEGIKALKGTDAHRVAFIRPIAEQLGFLVGLASLTHQVSGAADDDFGYHGRRSRYDYYDEDEDEDEREDTPGMAEVESTTTTINDVVDLCGSALIPMGKLHIDDDCLIPKEPFEDERPDKTEYEGYMGNGAGQLDHWYKRTALVFIRPSCVEDICYKAGGVAYAYARLKMSSTLPPTDTDRLWATRVLEKGQSLTKDYVLTLLDYALKWGDLGLWKGATKSPSSTLKGIDNTLFIKGWKVFSFESVCSSYSELVARSTDLRERINFIYSLPSQSTGADLQNVRAWCQKESDKVLSSYNSVNVEDIPIIMSIIRSAGLQAFSRTMLPNLLKRTGTYKFMLSLRKALIDGRQSILERQANAHLSPSSSGPSPTTDATMGSVAPFGGETNRENDSGLLLDDIIKRCLDAAALQWSDVGEYNALGYHHYGHRYAAQPAVKTTKTDRIVEIIEQAINSNGMDTIKTLFVSILKAPGDITTKFTQVYTPFIPRLRAVLVKTGLDLHAPPFIDLLQIFIGSYLRDVLGRKGQVFNAGLRKIGCGCSDCQLLDNFIMDPTTTSTNFRLLQKRRTHLEHRINSARDLCTHNTIRSGSPHALQVTKLPSVIAASTWSHRQHNARTFLASIGSDSDIARIMGSSYPDVAIALQGTRPFSNVRTVIEVPATMNSIQTVASGNAGPAGTSHLAPYPVQTPVASSSGSAVPASAPAAPHRLAGTKRRALVQLGPVIDLTEEDSS